MQQLQALLTNNCCWSPRVSCTKRLCMTRERHISAMTGVVTIMARSEVAARAKEAGHAFSTNTNMDGMSTYELQVSTTLRQYRMQKAATVCRRGTPAAGALDAVSAASAANRRS